MFGCVTHSTPRMQMWRFRKSERNNRKRKTCECCKLSWVNKFMLCMYVADK